MADIGRITVPTIPAVGTFPLVTDYPHGMELEPAVWVHSFGTANAKIEQRFWRGNGARRFLFQKQRMSPADRNSLVSFWNARQGAYEPFSYDVFLDGHDQPATTLTVRFEDPTLTLDEVMQHATTVGLVFVEEITTGPTHTLTNTVTRFPSTAMESDLLSQVQTLIPLVHIVVTESGHPDNIFLSDRIVTVGAQAYLPRLLGWNGIEQSINGASDTAELVFGDADRVMTDLSNDTDLWRARLEFSLYHLESQTKLDFWSGLVADFQATSDETFTVRATDILSALTLPYPRRRIQRRCWKEFDDGVHCPYTAQGSGGDPNFCDKGFATTDGCQSHGMDNFHGGVIAKPEKIVTKDNSKGFFGFGRPKITSATIISDTIYGQVLAEIYTDADMEVPGHIAAGIDEGDFYAALGVVGEGELTAYGTGHRLDTQLHHGPGGLGLEESLGADPNSDPFDIDELSVFGPERAGGTAFVMIRRINEPGLQISQLAEHDMIVVVNQGLKGFTWSAPGSRTSGVLLTNPIWVALNAFLKGLYLDKDTAANQEEAFVAQSAVDMAAICDTLVSRIVGSGTVKQYLFKGALNVEKPLRDWLSEILACCLGYFTFEFGKLKFGIRNDSSTIEAFTEGNIVWRTLRSNPYKPSFNHITGHFGDEEFAFGANSVELYDIDHAKLIGFKGQPRYEKQDINFVGVSTKDQAARLITTMLREQLGGLDSTEWRKAREHSFKTTALALAVEPGMVVSITHPDVIGGGPVEMRVESLRLNEDFTIDVLGRTTTNGMYDLTVGPKPADVQADPLPGEAPPDLSAGPVTNLSASEDGFVEEDGTVRSEVTMSYDEPSPIAAFAGVKVFGARLDTHLTNDTGNRTEEPFEITEIPKNDAPSDRRWLMDTLPVVAGVSGAMRLFVPSFNNNGKLNDVLTAPSVDVLLDGKDSAPNGVGNIHCQEGVADGSLISWDESAARDARAYRIANVGDVVPPADIAVTGATNASPIVITTALAHNRTTGDRVEIRQVLGNRAANGLFSVTVLTTTTFELDGTSGSGAYVSGGFMSVVTCDHLIAQVPVNPDGSRGTFIFKPKVYRGNSNGTTITFGVAGDNFWPANALIVGGVGRNVKFINADGTVENHQALSSTARTITFAAASIPSGEVTVRIEGPNNENNIYVGVDDSSGNHSDWAPDPPTVLECVPYALDRTKDVGPPAAPDNVLGFAPGGSIFAVHPEAALFDTPPGAIFVRLMVQSQTETETDFDLAKKLSINGIDKIEIRIVHSDDGVTGLTSTRFPFDAPNARENFTHVGTPFDEWRWTAIAPLIWLPNQGIDEVFIRVRNSHGWSPESSIPAVAPPGAKPFFTGAGALVVPVTAGPEVIGPDEVHPNLSKSMYRRVVSPTADFTFKPPEYRGGGGTPGLGANPAIGEEFRLGVLQGTSKVNVLFDSSYKGDLTSKYVVDVRDGALTIWTFHIRATNAFDLVGYVNYIP